jgi:hypothetical protein
LAVVRYVREGFVVSKLQLGAIGRQPRVTSWTVVGLMKCRMKCRPQHVLHHYWKQETETVRLLLCVLTRKRIIQHKSSPVLYADAAGIDIALMQSVVCRCATGSQVAIYRAGALAAVLSTRLAASMVTAARAAPHARQRDTH